MSEQRPGVFVQEVSAFPPALIGVATAVPAFIGYTEKGEPFQPVAITSMADFEAAFVRFLHERGH